jgi:uncharacterized membrane protein YhaH (DUF805 family)
MTDEQELLLGLLIFITSSLGFIFSVIYIFYKTFINKAPDNKTIYKSNEHTEKRDSATIWERVVLLATLDGTSNRIQYLTTQLLTGITIFILIVIFLSMLEASVSALAILIVLAAILTLVWLSIAVSVRRMRDTGVNVWWVLSLLVPPVNIAATAFLLLVPSDEFKGKGF